MSYDHMNYTEVEGELVYTPQIQPKIAYNANELKSLIQPLLDSIERRVVGLEQRELRTEKLYTTIEAKLG